MSEEMKREKKTSIALDKLFREFIAGERNKYLVERKLTHISLEEYLKERLGYVKPIEANSQ